MTTLIRLLNLLMAGLVSGTLFGIWIGFNPKNLSAQGYVEQQQNAIRALNVLMPILGLITIIITIIAAILQRHQQTAFITLLIAAVLLIISGLITKFENQPINKIVMTWDKTNVPGNWSEFREKWWLFHKWRTLTSFLAFCFIIWGSMRKD